MTSLNKTHRSAASRRAARGGVAALLCGSILSAGCTGNAGADGGLVGAGAGGLTYLGLKAAGVKDKAALGIAVGVGAAAGVITFLGSDAKYKREADAAEEDRARQEADRVRDRDRMANRERTEDYYVPVSRSGDEVGVQKIDVETNTPKGDVLIYSEKDLKDAQTGGQTVKIDGHELAGQL